MKDFNPKTNPNRPAMHYHGGKWRIALWVISHFPEHHTYVESFGGAASILLRKERSAVEIYNDLDDDVVNVFRVMRSRGQLLKRQLELTPFSRTEFQSCYGPRAESSVERARRMIVRSFMGHGGNGAHVRTGFRSHHERRCGPEKAWDSYPSAMASIVERFKGVVIENRKAVEIIKRCDSKRTLHYVDPPYVPSTRDSGKDYQHELTEDDHIELADTLHSLKGSIVLSGYPCPLYDKLYRGWKTSQRETRCASTALRTEKLWIKTR